MKLEIHLPSALVGAGVFALIGLGMTPQQDAPPKDLVRARRIEVVDGEGRSVVITPAEIAVSRDQLTASLSPLQLALGKSGGAGVMLTSMGMFGVEDQDKVKWTPEGGLSVDDAKVRLLLAWGESPSLILKGDNDVSAGISPEQLMLRGAQGSHAALTAQYGSVLTLKASNGSTSTLAAGLGTLTMETSDGGVAQVVAKPPSSEQK